MFNLEFIDERELNANASIKDLEPLSARELASLFDRITVLERAGQPLLRISPLGGGSLDFHLVGTRAFSLRRNSEVVVFPSITGRPMTFQMLELRTPKPTPGTNNRFLL
jgi:hypothetical protein